jgi:curved DNA-binding protein
MSPEEFAEIFGDRGYNSNKSFGGFSDFFSTIFGMGENYDLENQDYYPEFYTHSRTGRNIQGEITITLEDAYHGTRKLIDIGKRRIEAVIPKGIQENKKIRLSGQGEAGSKGGQHGDLLLTVKILPHQKLSRDGDDLNVNLEIDFYTAVLGGEARVNTLAGEVLLKIPPKTQTGKSFRLKSKGMPIINQPGKYGDFYVKISIVLPEDISKKEMKTLQEIRKQRLNVKGE